MAPRARRNRARSVVIVVAAVIALSVTGLLAFMYLPGFAPQTTLLSAASSTASSPPSTPPDDGPKTKPDDIQETLTRQGDALIKGDEAGWLGVIDPGNIALVDQFQRYYAVLRALKVTQWYAKMDTAELRDALERDSAPATFDISIFFAFCWQSNSCPAFATYSGYNVDGFTATVRWRLVEGRYLISRLTLPKELPWYEDHPWLKAAMRSAVGDTVTVFAGEKSAVDLDDVLGQAEAAARVASSYGRWIKPKRFVIYLADEAEWKKWFGGPPGINAIGVAVTTTIFGVSIVLRTQEIPGSLLDDVLRHEIGHVVTLLGATGRGPDYLVEGIAEWIEANGRSVSQYRLLDDVRRYFESETFKGDLDSLNPYADDALASQAAYGAGYLTWKCIEEKYGIDKMWGFATIAVRENDGAARGAEAQLGTSWATVKKQCVQYIKSVY